MKSKNSIDRDSFLKELTKMTPDEINQIIASNGKGPKVVQLLCRIESGVRNNTATTQM